MSNRPTSEVLNFAADLIEERGWISGHEGMAATGPLCIQGAILAATGVFVENSHGLANTCPAGRAVRLHLEYPEDYDVCFGPADVRRPLWWFNDSQGRTAAEVIEVLRATAVIEAARESTARTDDAARRVGIEVAGL